MVVSPYLHGGNIGVGRGLASMGVGGVGLRLADVLLGGVEGGVGHCDCGDEVVWRGAKVWRVEIVDGIEYLEVGLVVS